MTKTREKVINILIDNSDKYISGEYISDILGLSRASIWKHIKALKSEGFDIESKSGHGYRLHEQEKRGMNSYEIKHKLKTSYMGQEVYYFDSIDSTNIYANTIANKVPEGSVVVAKEQTQGKGRSGKVWVSDQDQGIYFSTILKPSIPITRASFLTQVAGAALATSLEKLGIPCQIKWPNDLVLNGKKIAGILTEMRAEIESISYIVVGIGVNVGPKTFDQSIANVATSLANEGYEVSELDLIRGFFLDFEDFYEDFKNKDYRRILDILKDKSAVLGKEIYVIRDGQKEKVFAENIDEYGNLIVRNELGFLEEVFTGEISIRGLDSYI
nr:biotin--[acetyl-CoA-carboxylase] ligase [uncultured Peptostreptococcus sp.]